MLHDGELQLPTSICLLPHFAVAKRRVLRLRLRHLHVHLHRLRILSVTSLLMVTPAGAAAGALFASAAQEPPARVDSGFEVVSVKYVGPREQPIGSPVSMLGEHSFKNSGQRLTFELTLLSILKEAYGLDEWQIVGPDWLR